ncbi:hypothetical protein V1264_024433 [Littorina saxatilis]|uniref:Orange domain-containing protein n=2 Tax=Littorina saxatilis TaxID=31220 RepID=A0AAN9FYM3_9CAEN
MEKADILEMAVKHLRQIQRQQYTSGGADPTLSDKYRLGFNECAQEVSRYLGAADDDDAELRARLLNHLANCIASADSPSPLSSPSSSPGPSLHGQGQVSSSTPGSADSSGSAGIVTPLTPIPVRPGSQPSGNLAGFSLAASGGGDPPLPAALLVSTGTAEINNNVATLANNNVVHAADGSGTNAGFRSVSHCVTLTTATSPPQTSFSAGKVIGELQVMPPKTATGGEVAFVLPANMMTGGQFHSYIIPIMTSPPTSVSFTHNPAAAGTAHASLPLPLPVMAAPHVSGTSVTAATPQGLVAFAPGGGISPATILPSSSVGHVVGLNASLAWHPAATSTVYNPSPFSAPAFSVAPVQTTSQAALAGPSSVSPSATVSSLTRAAQAGDSNIALLPSASPERSPENLSINPRLAFPGGSSVTGDSVEMREDVEDRSARVVGGLGSLLHSQLVRPQGGSAGFLPQGYENVWRPW